MTAQLEVEVTPPVTPAQITITDYQTRSWGLPDVEFNTLIGRIKRCQHGGVIGTTVASSTATTVTVPIYAGHPFTTNQFAPVGGYPRYLILIGLVENGLAPGELIRQVVHNAGTVTIAPNSDEVVGSGTTFTAAMEGAQIYVDSSPYGTTLLVATVVDATHLILSGPVDSGITGASGLSYEIFRDITATQQYIPWAVWEIASNDDDTFTLAAGHDTTAFDRGDGTFGLQPGDVLLVTSLSTIGSDELGNFAQDPEWLNSLNYVLDSHGISAATNATPVVVTTSTPHGLVSRNRVIIQDCLGNTTPNGVRYVNVVDEVTVELYSDAELSSTVAADGDYLGYGLLRRQLEGLEPGAETGRELYCIHGAGAGSTYVVKTNTRDKIYINGDWKAEHDATSVFIVNNPEWEQSQSTASLTNSKETELINLPVSVQSYGGKVVFFQVFTADGGGHEAFRPLSPWRLVYVAGRNVGQEFTAVFVLPGNATVADDVLSNRGRLQINDRYRVKLTGAYATAKTTGPSGGDWTADIQISRDGITTWSSIFPTGEPVTIVDGDRLGEKLDFAIADLYDQDEFRLDVLTANGAVDVEVTLRGTVLPR
jgi:hypothetical protein